MAGDTSKEAEERNMCTVQNTGVEVILSFCQLLFEIIDGVG